MTQSQSARLTLEIDVDFKAYTFDFQMMTHAGRELCNDVITCGTKAHNCTAMPI